MFNTEQNRKEKKAPKQFLLCCKHKLNNMLYSLMWVILTTDTVDCAM